MNLPPKLRQTLRGEYRRWAALSDRLESGLVTAEDRRRASALAADNPLCQREAELLGELRLSSPPLELADRQMVASTLGALRAQLPVVALRPGTAPPARSRPTALRWLGAAFAASALAAGVVLALLLGSAGPNGRGAASAPRAAVSAAVSSVEEVGSTAERGALAAAEGGSAGATAAAEKAGAGRLALFSGEVRVDGELQRVAGARLAHAQRVEVVWGRACLWLNGGVVTCLGERALVRLPLTSDGERGLEVARGRVIAKLDKQPAGHGFSLEGGGTRARALGTVFALVVDDGVARSVDVLEGTVRVSRGTRPSDDVPAGRRWQAGEQSELDQRALREGRELLRGVATTQAANAASSIVLVESEPRGAMVELDGQELGTTPLSVLAESRPGTHSLWLRLDGHAAEQHSFDFGGGEVHRLSFELEPAAQAEPAAAPRSANVATNVGASDLLSEARALVRQGRWAEAASSYRRLRSAYPGSAEAKTVAVALGQLELDRLGQPELARRSFQSYLDRGGGALAGEARFGKLRALRALGEHEAERREIREYLAAYPTSVNAPALRRRLGELAHR